LLGQEDYETFLDFLIEEKFMDENLTPSRRFFKIGLSSPAKEHIVVRYFKMMSADTLPRRHPRKKYALFVSEFGLESLITLYNLKNKFL